MKIINTMRKKICYTAFPATLHTKDSGTNTITQQLLTENCLNVYIGNMKVLKFVCTPEHLGELVLGYFYSEGLIQTVDDIDLIYISENGHRADITFHESCNLDAVWPQVDRVLSSTGSKRLWPGTKSNLTIKPLPEHSWREENIYLMVEKFFGKEMEIYSHTRATHSCIMNVGKKTYYTCEDIGRHNALDKVIGMALRDGLDLSKTAVYSSGRIPIDMVLKVIRSRIPVLVSKTMPSQEAVELAHHYNLTLICSAHPESIIIFNR